MNIKLPKLHRSCYDEGKKMIELTSENQVGYTITLNVIVKNYNLF